MPNPSRTYLLVEERLGADLSEHVIDLRRGGASWHAVAIDLNQRTEVAVTPETVRLWFPGVGRGDEVGAA